MNFLFGCCTSDVKGDGYQVRSFNQNNKVQIKYVPSLTQLSNQDYKSASQIMRIKKSQYPELIQKFKGKKQKWTDQSFPPNAKSLGNIPNVSDRCQWKRISQFVKDPKLFVDGIDPTDIIKGAIASMAQKKFTIERVFGDQTQFNPNGIYKVQMRVNGNIEQILVDDYIPLDYANKPFFCQPHFNEFWALIIEKAWAKVHGSYANILNGCQTDVYRSLGCCPADMFHIKSSKQSRDKVWKFLLQYSRRGYPISCITNSNSKNWEECGLSENQCYNIICAEILEDTQHQTYRILKLHNPWSKDEWKGKGNESDKKFWTSIIKDENEKRFSDSSKLSFAGDDGIFFIPFEDFCQYFEEVYVCLIENKPMYEVQSLTPNGKNGNIYMFDVKQQSSYSIELHQSKQKRSILGSTKDAACRSTIILAKGKDYEFIDGVLKHNEFDTQLRAYLNPGKYFVYCKLDPTVEGGQLPLQASLSTYSTNFVDIKLIEKFHIPAFFKKVFLAYARQNKKKQYENGNMWVSYKLLFEKGGFAYVAFGNQIMSSKKFVIEFDQKDFNDMHYTLKRPWKGCGKKKITIKPGQEEIIVCRVINNSPKQMKFPPPLNIVIEEE